MEWLQLGESFCPGMKWLQGGPSVLRWNGSRGLLLSWDGTTQGESVLVERHQGSHSVLGWNDSMGDILSWDGRTPGESFCPGIGRLQGSHSVLVKRLQGSPSVMGWNDSRRVSPGGTTPGKSFCHGVILSWIHPRTDGLQRSPSVLGWNDY